MRSILAAVLCFTASFAFAQNNTTWPYQTYKTQPTFQPPQLNITRYGTPAPGYLFFAPAGAKSHQTAPLITTNDGELVYQGAKGNPAFNWGVQTYRDQPVIVYWNGTIYPEPVGRGYGSVYILDNTYSVIANVSLPGHFVTSAGTSFASNVDLHEIYVTNRDTVLVTANNVSQTDLTSVGGPRNGWVVSGMVYEIDIKTNNVLFSWNSLDHLDQIPFSVSTYPLGSEGFNAQNQSAAWGYFHINAVAPFNDGYIISSRYTCSEILIGRNGSVIWRLSGRDGGDFTMGPNTNFCYQHDIRPVYSDPKTYKVPTNLTMHLHDNANCPIDFGHTPTSGLLLNVNQETKQVSLVRRFENSANKLYSPAQGSYQALPNNNVFLGHGYIPWMQEFAPNGSIVQATRFGAVSGQISYRAFKQPWVGCPLTPPAVYVDTSVDNAENMTIYMSWNGATEFDTWVVHGGSADGPLVLVETVARSGFETSLSIPRTPRLKVQAMMRHGRSKCRHSRGQGWSSMIEVY